MATANGLRGGETDLATAAASAGVTAGGLFPRLVIDSLWQHSTGARWQHDRPLMITLKDLYHHNTSQPLDIPNVVMCRAERMVNVFSIEPVPSGV